MLRQLIKRFFSVELSESNTLNIKNQIDDRWREWLQPISDDKPSGEDLTYNDLFQEIKDELDKLSGIDYSLIITQSERIIKELSKDIRVVTYYCFAKLQTEHAKGFADGVELLAGLLIQYGSDLYPSRH